MAQSFDEVEDLTRFADESFDTDDIDLFEFTGDDDSPLTRLKSIILSLDWEISDDILDELKEEIAALSELWHDDKVAQVYLQGIDKVGKYLRLEGAYAHPNAIKLLLTLFYNYEKIISSPDISGDEITAMLKADIRKFKVLQYQIGKTKGHPAAVEQASDHEVLAETDNEHDPLVGLEASILGLDWEVTDEGLEKFRSQAEKLRENLADNQHALVLIQGLQAIGAYISEEKANAHPDAFTLMHSFYDGLKSLVSNSDLDSEARQEIIIEHVGRLNSLKEIIAGHSPTEVVDRADDKIDEVLDIQEGEEKQEEKSAAEDELNFAPDETEPVSTEQEQDEQPAGDSLDFDFDLDSNDEEQPAGNIEDIDEEGPVAGISETVKDKNEEQPVRANAAMETADEEYPEDILDPAAIQPVSDEVADEFIEEELSFGGGAASALDGFTDDSLDADTSGGATDVEEELELLFADSDTDDTAGTGVGDDGGFDELELDFDASEPEDEQESSKADFADALDEADNTEEDDDLDFDQDLFDTEEESTDEKESIAPALADADDEGERETYETDSMGDESAAELEGKLDSFFGITEDEEEETAPAATDDEAVTPALADADEESGFSEERESSAVDEEPAAELEDKLDAFFGSSDEPEPDIDEPLPVAAGEESAAMEEDTVIAALSDVDEEVESGFSEEAVASTLGEDPSDEILGKLDSFFGDGTPEESSSNESVPMESEDETVPALADVDEESGFNEEAVVAALDDSPVADIDDKLDSFFGEETQKEEKAPAAAATTMVAVASAAAAFVTAPTPDKARKIAEIAAKGRDEEMSDNQLVLLSLIDGASALLAENPEHGAEFSDIVSRLAADMENADQPGVMVAAVNNYTAWQKKLFANPAASPQDQTSTAPAVAGDEITAQINSGFARLKESLQKEFDALREELKK